MIPSDEKGSEPVQLAPTVTRVQPMPGPSTSDNPAEIRAQMAETRAEMSVTIDALQERLDPERLKDEAKTKARATANRLKEQATARVREATIGKLEGKVGEVMNRVEDTASETRSGIADTIRQNPIPAALIGAGLAWLFFKGSGGNGRANRPSGRSSTYDHSPGLPLYGGMQAPSVETGTRGGGSVRGKAQEVASQAGATVQHVGQQVQQLGDKAQDQVESLADQAKGSVQQLGDKAQDQVESLTGQAKDTVQQLGDKAQDQIENLTGQVKGSVQQFGGQAQDQAEELRGDVEDQVQSLTSEVQLQAQRLSDSFNRALRENPLALGVVAIALGAAAGMAAPQTPQEDQLFGDAREHVLQKAQVAAHEALDQVQKVAEQAQQTASAPPR